MSTTTRLNPSARAACAALCQGRIVAFFITNFNFRAAGAAATLCLGGLDHRWQFAHMRRMTCS